MYCEVMQSGRYSKYDLTPDHVPAHPLSYWKVIQSNQPSSFKSQTADTA